MAQEANQRPGPGRKVARKPFRKKKRQLHSWFRGLRYARRPFFKAYRPRLHPELIASRIRLIEERNAAYFRIPKAANSTVMATFMAHEGLLADTHTQADIEAFKFAGPRVTDLSQADLNAFRSEWFKFTLVRHPVTRLLSAWRDKGLKYAPEIRASIGLEPDDDLTLDEFLCYLESGGLDENAHWARQVDLICIPVDELQFIGRFERLAEHVPEIMRRIFGRSLGLHDFRPHATGADAMAHDLDSALKSRIYKLYEPDFEAFEYSLR